MNRRIFLAGLVTNVALAEGVDFAAAKQDAKLRQQYLDTRVVDIPTKFIGKTSYRTNRNPQQLTMGVNTDYGLIGQKQKSDLFCYAPSFERFNENEFTVALRQQDDICKHIYNGLFANAKQHSIQEISHDHGEMIAVLFWLRASQIDNFGRDKNVRESFFLSQQNIFQGTINYLRTVLKHPSYVLSEKNLASNYLIQYGPRQFA